MVFFIFTIRSAFFRSLFSRALSKQRRTESFSVACKGSARHKACSGAGFAAQPCLRVSGRESAA
jgi:hypothetical protein